MPEKEGNTPPTVLMCPPAFYEIPAIENNSMDPGDQPDPAKMWKQWTVIRNLYTKLGLTVYDAEPEPRFWDMIFTANCAWGASRTRLGEAEYIMSNFRQPIRQGEKKIFKRTLSLMGKNTFELPDGVFFEGQGDVVTLDNAILFGHGPRSSPEAGEYIRRMLLPTRQVVYLELTGNDFYHLDTCCMALRGTDKQGLMYYPKAFTKESVQKIEDLGGVDRLAISPDAAKTFACNSVFVNNVVLLNVPFNYSEEAFELSAAGEFLGEMREDIRYADMVRRLPSYPLIINFLRKFGYKIIPVYTSEFAKSGAGVRCLTFFVD